jgi:hypothetical protein
MTPTSRQRLDFAEILARLGNQGDAEGLAACFAEKGVFFPAPGSGIGPVVGQKEIAAYFKNLFASSSFPTVAQPALFKGEPVCLILKEGNPPVRLAFDRFVTCDEQGLLTEVQLETDTELLAEAEPIANDGSDPFF